MATNVLVIPEDFRKDQYVLKPLVEAMFRALGVRARVQVCRDPLLGGVGEAMKWPRIQDIVERYRGMTDVFLLIVDRDCNATRRDGLQRLEALAERELEGTGSLFLTQDAYQEVEVWVLAGLRDLPKSWSWRAIREECDPKERYFDAIVRQRGRMNAPLGGRPELAREAAARYPRIRKLCPEDVGAIETRLRSMLRTPP
jgi:hypothetical protein